MPKISFYAAHVERWQSCTGCALHERRQRVVLYRGAIPCDVLFVGEAPGESEDVLGKPFAGPAGKILDDQIRLATMTASIPHKLLKPTECDCDKSGGCNICDGGLAYCKRCKGGESELNVPCLTRKPLRIGFTNIVACIPKGEDGRKTDEPDDESVKACSARLVELVTIARPSLIVAVGKLAETRLSPGFKHSIPIPKTRMTKITHPAAILRASYDQREFMARQAVVTLRNALEEMTENITIANPPPKGKAVVSPLSNDEGKTESYF